MRMNIVRLTLADVLAIQRANCFIFSMAFLALPFASPKRSRLNVCTPLWICLPAPVTRNSFSETSTIFKEHATPLHDPQLIPVVSNVTKPVCSFAFSNFHQALEPLAWRTLQEAA